MSFVKAVAVAAMLTFAAVVPAAAQLEAEAEAAVTVWLNAVASGEQAALDAVLAPEFQIQRADGTGYGKAGYVGGGAAQLAAFEIRDLVATGTGDLMVVRYMLLVSETIEGQPVQALAPRLTVFRRDGDSWLVVAHANFARIER